MPNQVTISIRRAEPSDYAAYQQIPSGPKAGWGTLHLPFPSVEHWRKALAEPTEDAFDLVACVDGEAVGQR